VRTVDPAKIDRIIDAAAQLFAERPYHEVRMDDIAAKANVAKGTIYLRFKDKDDLYRALAIDSLRKLGLKISDRLDGIDDPRTRLSTMLKEVVHFFEHNAFTWDLINQVERLREQSGPDTDKLTELRNNFMMTIQSILASFPEAAYKSANQIALGEIALSGMIKAVVKELPRPWPDDLADEISGMFLEGFLGRNHQVTRPQSVRARKHS
jgi:AcrR family transcriptional regulator